MKFRTDDGIEFYIESSTLILNSKFFETLLSRHSRNTTVLIKGISSAAVREIVKYFEIGSVGLDNTNICDIFRASNRFQLKTLTEEVRVHLPLMITPSNCIGIFKESEKMNRRDISKLCYFYIWCNFHSVLESSNISDLSFEHLESFLLGNGFDAGSEVVMWNAICCWIEKNPRDRLKCVPAILRCLNIPHYDITCVISILNHKHVLGNHYCRNIFLRMDPEYNDAETLKKDFVCAISDLTKALENAKDPQILLCGNNRNGLTIILEIGLSAFVYKYQTRIKPLTRREDKYSYFAMYSDANIYIYQSTPHELFSYNLIDLEWKSLYPPPFRYCLVYTFGATASGNLYAVWENVRNKTLFASVYTSSTGEWSKDEDGLTMACDDVSRLLTAELHENIYVVCVLHEPQGTNGTLGVVLDPVTDVWSELEMPHSMRSPCELLAYRNVLVMLEGQVWVLKTYEPRTGIWRNSKMMPRPFVSPEALVLDGRLIIHEKHGIDTQSQPLYWDMTTDSWHDASSLFAPPMIYHIVKDSRIISKHFGDLMQFEFHNLVKEWM